ncbi:MAG: HD domain-containing protein [Nitrosopumilus sp.]|nr:HD domain-containing protein [Nitrosopumilus sp.]MDA7942427.1 HD domain-containing protein [Nitrosopumilus sp.]
MAHTDIMDPIHGFIRLDECEREVADSGTFQRLRRIRQLSGAHFVYPAAQHTRFEHSLGVMHIAGLAGSALAASGDVPAGATRVLRLAGLLHDVAHGPFSHLFEEVEGGASHEEAGRQVITRSEIGEILSRHGVAARQVADVAFGRSGKGHLNEVISGALSADMMDYLLRDGYFTGAEHARIDHRRITGSLRVRRGRLALERSALRSFESMVISRYQMFRAVYFHKTVRAANVVLADALRDAAQELGPLGRSTDEYVLSMIESSDSPSLARARRLVASYQARRLPKCVLDVALRKEPPGAARLRSRIAREAGVDEGSVFVDSTATPSISLAPSKDVQRTLLLSSGRSAEEVPLSEIPLVSAIAGYMNILRVYSEPSCRKKVEIAAQGVAGGLR